MRRLPTFALLVAIVAFSAGVYLYVQRMLPFAGGPLGMDTASLDEPFVGVTTDQSTIEGLYEIWVTDVSTQRVRLAAQVYQTTNGNNSLNADQDLIDFLHKCELIAEREQEEANQRNRDRRSRMREIGAGSGRTTFKDNDPE